MADEKNRDTLDEAIWDYVLDITDDPKAIEYITEMIDKMPDIEAHGALEKWQAIYLATEIDELSYQYDPEEYRREVANRRAEIVSIAEDSGSQFFFPLFQSLVFCSQLIQIQPFQVDAGLLQHTPCAAVEDELAFVFSEVGNSEREPDSL